MKNVKRLFSYVKHHREVFILGNVMLIMAVALRLLMPRIGKFIIDDIIGKSADGGIVPVDLLVRTLILYGVVGIGAAILDFFANYFLIVSSNKFTEAMRNEVYDHIHSLPVSYFDQVPAGTITSRITNDTETIRQSFYINVFSGLLTSIVTMIGIYIALFLARWEIGIGMLIVLPGVWWFKTVYQKHATKAEAEIREINGEVSGKLNEIAKNVQLTRSYGKQEAITDGFRELTKKQVHLSQKLTRFDWAMFNIPGVVFRLLMFMAVAWLAYGHFNLNLEVSAGFIYLIVEYVSSISNPINRILDVLSTIIRSTVSAERVFTVLDTKIEDNGKTNLETTEGKMEAKAIHFSYVEGQKVLKNVDFTAEPGESVAIVGPTGSGKSSLLNLLFRFYDPQEGEVLIDGENIKQFDRSSLRSHMGIVLQEPFLIEDTVYHNISLGNPDITREDAEAALIRVGGQAILDQDTKGLDQKIIERGKNLSAGQRQLISFARALAYNPKILILDEATASIDTETEQIIQRAMNVVKAGRTTIIIAHRLSTIRDSDRIYVLVDGVVAEEGRHEELVERKGHYWQMLKQS